MAYLLLSWSWTTGKPSSWVKIKNRGIIYKTRTFIWAINIGQTLCIQGENWVWSISQNLNLSFHPMVSKWLIKHFSSIEMDHWHSITTFQATITSYNHLTQHLTAFCSESKIRCFAITTASLLYPNKLLHTYIAYLYICHTLSDIIDSVTPFSIFFIHVS